MAYHEHTFAFGERPKTIDEMAEWLRVGKAEIWVHYSGKAWLCWGVGSDRHRPLSKREYAQIQRRVTLVESKTSKRENARHRSSVLHDHEYAAAGQMTWRDAFGWYND